MYVCWHRIHRGERGDKADAKMSCHPSIHAHTHAYPSQVCVHHIESDPLPCVRVHRKVGLCRPPCDGCHKANPHILKISEQNYPPPQKPLLFVVLHFFISCLFVIKQSFFFYHENINPKSRFRMCASVFDPSHMGSDLHVPSVNTTVQ